VVATAYRFDLERLNPARKDFDLVRAWKSGLIKLSANLDFAAKPLTAEQAVALATEYAVKRGLPEAVVEVIKPMYVERNKDRKSIMGYTVTLAHHEGGMLVAGDGIVMIVQSDGNGVRPSCDGGLRTECPAQI